MKEQFHFVIRFNNEANIENCKQSILFNQNFAENNITIIQENPFHRALVQMANIEYVSSVKWIIAIDADVILVEDFLDKLLWLVKIINIPKLLVFQGVVACNLTKEWRDAGLHIYSKDAMLNCGIFLEQTRSDIRPESAWWRVCRNKGYSTLHTCAKLGYHQFFSSDDEYFKQGFNQAIKHKNKGIQILHHNINNIPFTKGFIKGLGIKTGFIDNADIVENGASHLMKMDIVSKMIYLQKETKNWEIVANLPRLRTKDKSYKMRVLYRIRTFTSVLDNWVLSHIRKQEKDILKKYHSNI